MPLQEAQEKAIATLDKLGAKGLAERSPFQLSHGQRQRIALAGALVTNPAVILLDEPSSALDPRGRISLADALRSISSSILIATHDVEFASRTCNRFLVLCEQGLRECRNCSDAEASLMGNVSVKSVGENPH
jgi:energy-coupling factor transporter ATP-binding protein EcfA2